MKTNVPVFIILLLTTIAGSAQQTWKMQPVTVQSRWAKEVSPKNALKEYPRPQLVRKNWQNLNGLWDYAITQKDESVPTNYDGKIMVPYPIESALSGVKKTLKPDQDLWYKTRCQKPQLAAGERLLLHFGAVDWQATVFVNGKELGKHEGGYTGFSFDITDALKAGSNELMVKVYDPTDEGFGPRGKQTLSPQNIYYTPSSGIWQTVWMEKVPAAYITGIRTTPDIDKGVVNIKVAASGEATGLQVEVTAMASGKVVSTLRQAQGDIQLKLPNARLWSPDDPFLYDLTVKLIKGTQTIDQISSYFGMRKISIQKDAKGIDRIFLNNQYTYNLGVLDQGFWPEGLYTAPTDEALAFDIKAIKAMGFNTIRKHIKVEPDRWYYHADKTGVLVWQDFVNPAGKKPDDNAKGAFEKGARETMEQLYNHPSIVTWVLFNEQWGSYDQKRLTEWVKTTDPSRLVNGHSGELLYVDDRKRKEPKEFWISSDMTDVHSYPNPMNAPVRLNKARVLGEFGGLGLSVPDHQWDDMQGWGYAQVSAPDLKGKYEIMAKRLKKLEADGLSASIYTQPFDVETEENGLFTYDREIIKIPVEEIREINSELVKQSKGFTPAPQFSLAKNINVDEKYPRLLQQFEAGKRDSAFLRSLILMAIWKKDRPNRIKVGNAFVDQLKQPYSKENLQFILKFTLKSSSDRGFEMALTQPEKWDAAFESAGVVNGYVEGIITAEEITPYTTGDNAKPDWDAIRQRVLSKYGSFRGLPVEELVLQKAKDYYRTAKDYKNFGKYYQLFYEKALAHPLVTTWATNAVLGANNDTWKIFEGVNDPKVLEAALKIQQQSMDSLPKISRGNDRPYDTIAHPEAKSAYGDGLDTYANLLHKLGRTAEAIEWEVKAVLLKESYKETLEKMKKGLPSWPMVTVKEQNLHQ